MKLTNEIWEGIDKEVPGWMSRQEAEFLVDNIKEGVYLEIGVAFGKSMRVVRRVFPQVHAMGIDKIDHGVDKKVEGAHVMLGDANELVEMFKDQSIDTLFIDGDHTFNGCMKDFIHWYPKVKKGGNIIFHDYKRDNNHIGVTQCVDAIKPLLNDFRVTSFICAGTK